MIRSNKEKAARRARLRNLEKARRMKAGAAERRKLAELAEAAAHGNWDVAQLHDLIVLAARRYGVDEETAQGIASLACAG